MTRRSVAIVTQAYHPVVGGVTEHVDATARALRARGHRVVVLTSGGHPGAPEEPDVVRLGRNFVVLFNGAENNIALGLDLLPRLRAALDRGRYDIVHVHCPLSPSLPLLAIRAANVPVVGTFHTVSSWHFPFRLFRPVLRPYFARLDRVLAVSDAAREEVLRHFSGPVTVLPNGVDLERFRTGVPPVARFDDGTPNILFVGRFDPRKGLPELFDACERLARDGEPFRLILVGDGSLRGRLERRSRGALAGRVHFEGRVRHDRLPRYYATATLFCSPARGGESFGMVLLEAMAMGVPVIASDIPGYRSALTHGNEGLLVPPRNPEALAAGLRLLLRDPGLRARLGSRGVATASRFGWDRIAAELEAIYASVLGGAPLAPAGTGAPAPLTTVPT